MRRALAVVRQPVPRTRIARKMRSQPVTRATSRIMGRVNVRWTRLAAILFVAVLATDLAGFDCSRLITPGMPCSSAGSPNACAGTGDCLCCTVADATPEMSPGAGYEPVGRASCAPGAATVDGVQRVPYRPPLLASLASAL